jgi:hypothetical protein
MILGRPSGHAKGGSLRASTAHNVYDFEAHHLPRGGRFVEVKEPWRSHRQQQRTRRDPWQSAGRCCCLLSPARLRAFPAEAVPYLRCPAVASSGPSPDIAPKAADLLGNAAQVRLLLHHGRHDLREILAFNSRLPLRISYSTTPNAHTSVYLSTRRPRACSGDIYTAALNSPVDFASPKSRIFTTHAGVILIVAGFR